MCLRVAWTAAVLLFAPFAATSAQADSDGYYCTGQGYLAYQFGGASPSIKPHRLHVMRLDITGGVEEPVTFELPQFQVHGMLCEERQIRIAGFENLYVVTLDWQLKPSTVSIAPLAERGRLPPEFMAVQRNLGEWSKAVSTLQLERVVLQKRPNGTALVLEIRPVTRVQRCVVDITTRVVELDVSGQPRRTRTIFEGTGRRECGELETTPGRLP